MSRPVDWTPLCDSDPVRGDPVEVAQMGRQYTTVAEAISSAAASLRRLGASTDGQISDAVDAMNDDCDEVASNISKAHERYAGVGEALTGYAPHLESAQATSLRALEAAKQAAHAQQSAQTGVDGAGDDADAKSAAQRRLDGAGDDLAAAQRILDGARRERDDAARVAISKIKDVQDSGDLNDSWWDDWGSKIVSVIQKIASAIATISGILALCVGWIPVIGQALAAVLGTIALVATAVSLVCNILLAATGKGDWSSVFWDGLSLATFGAGRVLGMAAKGSSKAAQGLARMEAGSMMGRNGSLTMRSLLGNEGLANISRNTARGMLRTGTREGALNGGNVLRSLRGIPGEFGDGLRTLRSANLSSVMQQAGPALRNIANGGGLKALYGETEMLTHAGLMKGLAPGLSSSPALAHAIQYSNIVTTGAVGANLAGNAQDIKSGLETIMGDDGGDPLNLGHDEMAR